VPRLEIESRLPHLSFFFYLFCSYPRDPMWQNHYRSTCSTRNSLKWMLKRLENALTCWNPPWAVSEMYLKHICKGTYLRLNIDWIHWSKLLRLCNRSGGISDVNRIRIRIEYVSDMEGFLTKLLVTTINISSSIITCN
jgi:hypothetical protein